MPLSWIYGGVMWVRNKLFDLHILPETEYEVPVVGIANLAVGGTGKTPHTEYVVGRLCGSFNIAVLSRGYKRKTRGFILANSKSTPDLIGDEPWQIYNKFGMRAKVAVCESRRKGISELLKIFPDLDLIVLDDSFQHRWVKPRISILLMEYGRPAYKDRLLPLGRLRESHHEINRADKVIITKCPDSLSPIDFRIVIKELDLMKFQKLYFSRYHYGTLKPVFRDEARFSVNLSSFTQRDSLFLLTGIAHPHYFVRHYKQYPCVKKVEHFPDHHDFSRRDIQRITDKFNSIKGERKIIVTTEKDAVRLVHNPYFPDSLKPYTFYQPIEVEFLSGTYEQDNDLICDLISELHLRDGAEEPGYEDNRDRDAAEWSGRDSRHYVASGETDYVQNSSYDSDYAQHTHSASYDTGESGGKIAEDPGDSSGYGAEKSISDEMPGRRNYPNGGIGGVSFDSYANKSNSEDHGEDYD